MTRYLDLEAFVNQLQRIGFKVRDLGLLNSALSRPRASLFGQDAYPSIYLKAAALMESIILNHPMIDGNKRSSWFGLNAFLLLNGLVIEADQVEAYEFVLVIATKKIDIESSANWIEKHSKKL